MNSSSIAVILALGFFLLANPALLARAQTPPSGPPVARVAIHQATIAFIGSAAIGGGTVTYRGRSYGFNVAGLGVGGVGASRLDAVGDVYGLRHLSDFEGAYLEIHSGWAVGQQGRGFIWLRNPNGVIMRLRAQRRGLALALGADGMIVRLGR
ncbi:MAG: hypothetical protein JOY67_08140 [Hyphomicrobiales bacterium]|nr:hypothetical protein [Hyphomicrobiales bacterium]MBV9518519.1 hypothetical protein [Hyphomicrobiales bacterium]